jgi:hypothetical protein
MPDKQVAVHTADKAIHKYNENLAGFADIQSRIRVPQPEVPQEGEVRPTLNATLAQNGQPNHFSYKLAMANKAGISGYNGSKEHDDMLMGMVSAQNQQKQANEQSDNENKYKEKEFGLKERELGIKEKQMENQKGPNADEIASSILNKFNK